MPDMNADLDIAVLIPCYNEVATVERLLRKVREVPLPLEVIVVDDGSTDRTGAIAEENAAKYPWMSVVHRDDRCARQRAWDPAGDGMGA